MKELKMKRGFMGWEKEDFFVVIYIAALVVFLKWVITKL